MFHHWHSEHIFVLTALLIVVAFGICYILPELLGALSYVTTAFFLFAGLGILAIGCLQLYNMYKNS